MQNKDIGYVDYLDSYLDINNLKIPRWIKKIFYKILNFVGYIRVDRNNFQLICVEDDLISKKMLDNLMLKLKENNYYTLVLSEKILENDELIKILNINEFNVLDGKWLYKFLLYEIISKIAYIKKENINNMEITILTNKDSDVNIENIKLLAKKCKILNILTDDIDKFKIVEQYIFNEFGTLINIFTNKRKACIHSDIILNFDLTKEQLRECIFKKHSVLIQLTKDEFENRDGITILFYKLNLPIKYIKFIENKNHFNEEILYESFLYHKTSLKNMMKTLKKDNISIKHFIGKNGKIPFVEFNEK